jgi:hypothetical protein
MKKPYNQQTLDDLPIYFLIILDTLLLRLSLNFTQLHFTPLHYTCRHFTSSNLNFTQLHFTTLSFGLIPFKFLTAPFHFTSPHFTPFIIAFLTLFLKVLGLQRKVPNASAASRFQFLMVLFTKQYFPISAL